MIKYAVHIIKAAQRTTATPEQPLRFLSSSLQHNISELPQPIAMIGNLCT